MNNYEYIISSLPDISLDWKFPDGSSSEELLGWIRGQLSEADREKLGTLLEGFKDESLNQEFYENALKNGNSFIRDYFTFDLNVRNGKAAFINKAFDRPADQDQIKIDTGEFPEAAKLDAALASPDLLSRERALDQLMWDKITELTTFNYFDLDAVLGFISKLRIISRWLNLDEKTGRAMFHSLIDEVRGTFEGVKYVAPKD